MTDTEKAALERRIDELCAEVEYNRQTSRSRLERIDQLKDENAKLCARIDELCAENERLRKANDTMRGDAFEIGTMLTKARDENAKLREQNDKLTNVVGCLMYVKPRDVTSILVNGKVQRIDELLADAGLRWESL